jgi:hypothetical protein
MDRRRAITALGSALPGLIWTLFPTMNVPPIALVIIGLTAWAVYWVFVEPRLHPTNQELQEALDKLINYRYLSDGADLQIKPAKGLSKQQLFIRHAPPEFREFWYDELGLRKPAPRRDRAR